MDGAAVFIGTQIDREVDCFGANFARDRVTTHIASFGQSKQRRPKRGSRLSNIDRSAKCLLPLCAIWCGWTPARGHSDCYLPVGEHQLSPWRSGEINWRLYGIELSAAAYRQHAYRLLHYF